MSLVMSTLIVESLISKVLPDISYVNNYKISIIIFILFFILILIITMVSIKKLAIKGYKMSFKRIVFTMILFSFFLHPLGYYLVLWIYGFPIDALNTMNSIVSFPIISLSFILIGFLMDWYWKLSSHVNK